MAINLSKGQKLDLSKDSSLTQVRLGLGWDPIKTKGLFGRIKEKAVDLDASVIGYDAAGNLLEVVFYGSLRSVNGSIIHHGDNLTGAGEGDDAEAEFFHFGQQACFFQIDFCHFRAGGERGFDPRFAFQPEAVGVARQECGGNDVARVGSVGATGNRSDDNRAVGHEAV